MKMSALSFRLVLATIVSPWTTIIYAEDEAEPQHARAELACEQRAIVAGQSFWVGLRFVMDEGWHVNWRNPGDAGLAPRLEWTLPAGFSAGEIQWPYPEVMAEPQLVSYGYHHEVLLPVRISAPSGLEAGTQIQIEASAHWIACRDVCLPESATMRLALAVAESPEPDPTWESRFEQAKRRLPVVLPDWRATLAVESTKIVLHLSGPAGDPIDSVYFAPYEADVIAHAAAQKWVATDSGYTLTLARPRNATEPPTLVAGLLLNPSGWSGPGSAVALEIEAHRNRSALAWPLMSGGILLAALFLALGVWGIRRLK
jgi:thiol:disulfide interchange protein DsbD